MMTDHGDELGTDWSQRHWRLVTVQAGGGLTVVRQRTRRSMQQLHLAGFLAKHSCTVAGIGEPRLGEDIVSFTASVNTLRSQSTRVPWRRPRAGAQAHQVGRSRRAGTRRGRAARTVTECGGEEWRWARTAKRSNGYTTTLLTVVGGEDIEERYTKDERGGSLWWYRRTSRTRST